MKIVFFGTPDFAVASLEAIHQSGIDIVLVVTAPDKPDKRKKDVAYPTAVKTRALELGLTVSQPTSLKNKRFIHHLESIHADLFVIVAFRMMPEIVWNMPRKGSVNLHGSLLPAYRGAAPINWAIINGETITGVTIFQLSHEIDTGRIIAQKEVYIDSADDFGTLYDKMKKAGATLLVETLHHLDTNRVDFRKQDETLVSQAPKLTNENTQIDFNRSAHEVYNFVRGLSPYPTAWCFLDEKRIKIFKCTVNNTSLAPGQWQSDFKHFLFIGCGENSISIQELQIEGKRKMTITEFLNGWKNQTQR
jgi:methionyl-tRNA formyltransferase